MTHGVTVFLYTFRFVSGDVAFPGNRPARCRPAKERRLRNYKRGYRRGGWRGLRFVGTTHRFHVFRSEFEIRHATAVDRRGGQRHRHHLPARGSASRRRFSRRCEQLSPLSGFTLGNLPEVTGRWGSEGRTRQDQILCKENFGGKRLLPAGGRRSGGCANIAATCAERDDRYHDDPNHGDPDASADSRLRNAFRIGAGSFVISGLWHDRQRGA